MFRTLGLTLGLSTCVLATALSVRVSTQTTRVDDILDHALARAAWIEEEGIRTRYRFTLTSQSQKLEKDGSVKEEALQVYDVAPVRGVPYARLISKDGHALEGKDLGDERKRYAKFVARLENGADDNDEDDSFIRFDDELVAKYDFTSAGVEMLDGREYLVLAFEPKPGKLPKRRRIDTASNKSRGRIWIDETTYEVGRVRFELIDTVRLWWGIMGSLSEARGSFDRRPLDAAHDETWVPRRAEICMNGRVLFASLHRSITNEWSDFKLADSSDQ